MQFVTLKFKNIVKFIVFVKFMCKDAFVERLVFHIFHVIALNPNDCFGLYATKNRI